MVEKPKPQDAPSNLIISGRYILQPEIFNLLADQPRGAGGEIQLTDAMQTLMHASSPSPASNMKASRFDCGSKVGFLTANVAYALDRDDIADDFLASSANSASTPSSTAEDRRPNNLSLPHSKAWAARMSGRPHSFWSTGIHLNLAIPPLPLIPPHKGGGRRRTEEDPGLRLPPPCGEGTSEGVQSHKRKAPGSDPGASDTL